MSLNASKIESKGKRERPDPLEPGTYPCRLVQVLGMGLQPQRPYMGEEKEPQYELNVTYEFLDEFLVDKETGKELKDKPRWLSESFPLHSLDSDLAKSTKRYMAIDPTKEFGGDWSQLVGTPCMVTIVQNPSKKDPEVIYENVASVSSMRAKDAEKAPELVNPPKVFDAANPDMEIFKSLPEYIQDKIKGNLDYEGSELQSLVEGNGGAKAAKKEEDNDDEDW